MLPSALTTHKMQSRRQTGFTITVTSTAFVVVLGVFSTTIAITSIGRGVGVGVGATLGLRAGACGGRGGGKAEVLAKPAQRGQARVVTGEESRQVLAIPAKAGVHLSGHIFEGKELCRR